ncbi:MAG: DUF115 domain-containing protein [Eubacteriales bacterium]|nr:DUF115 domain-containing protein [Eubacteriales bacterium]
MQRLIKEIANCITNCNRTTQYLRQQNYHAGLGSLNDSVSQFMNVMKLVGEETDVLAELGFQLMEDEVVGMLQGLMQAQEQEDYVLVSDLLELQIKPFLLQLQEILLSGTDAFMLEDEECYARNIAGIRARNDKLAERIEGYLQNTNRVDGNEFCSDNYVIEPTSSGHHTLLVQDERGQRYFHSNVNPITEAEIFARQYYSQEFSHYVVYGFGLGYHIQAMLEIDDGLYIDIVESDIQVIGIACKIMDLEWFYSNPRIKLFYDPEHKQLGNLLGEDKSLVIHYPSMKHIENEKLRMQLEKYFISDSGKRNFAIQFDNNFRDNLQNCDGYVDELEEAFRGKNAVIVAAGPSLDKNVEMLRKRPDNTVVVAVGTVFRKLIEMGIRPDCVVVLDAQPHLYKQVEGLEKQEIPLLCGATACKKIAERYEGKKYLVCQKGYPKAEEYANARGYKTYETGGSVSTIAMDICIQMGCKSIAFIGLDLAFTGGVSHASSTADQHVASKEESNVIIQSVDGGKVAASRLFVMYREWIERRVARLEKTIPVYDATEGGAAKKGFIVMSLKELFVEWKKEQNE